MADISRLTIRSLACKDANVRQTVDAVIELQQCPRQTKKACAV